MRLIAWAVAPLIFLVSTAASAAEKRGAGIPVPAIGFSDAVGARVDTGGDALKGALGLSGPKP